MMGVPISDEVVHAAAEGVSTARDALLAAVEPRVRLMVAARLSPRPEQFAAVDDITQEVLLATMTGLRGLRIQTAAGLRAFIAATARNKVADYIDGGRHAGIGGATATVCLETTIHALSGAAPLWALLSSSGTTPSAAFERDELAVRMLGELGRLPEHYRDIVTLAFFGGLTTREIAADKGKERGAVAMMLLRAIRILRRQMTGSSRCGFVDG
jgi:RNA polymerase sigma factor (sigma-70 family)